MTKFIIISFISLSLFSCSSYKIDIRQGNYVSQEMLNQLEVGMPARKVRLIMGTPLLIDTFHPDRWDYVYSFQPQGEEREQRHIALFFDEKAQLIRISGDVKVGTVKPTPEDENQPIPSEIPIL